MGHKFPCNIFIKLHVGCEMSDELPKLSTKKKKCGILKKLLDCNQWKTCINKGS